MIAVRALMMDDWLQYVLIQVRSFIQNKDSNKNSRRKSIRDIGYFIKHLERRINMEKIESELYTTPKTVLLILAKGFETMEAETTCV